MGREEFETSISAILYFIIFKMSALGHSIIMMKDSADVACLSVVLTCLPVSDVVCELELFINRKWVTQNKCLIAQWCSEISLYLNPNFCFSMPTYSFLLLSERALSTHIPLMGIFLAQSILWYHGARCCLSSGGHFHLLQRGLFCPC